MSRTNRSVITGASNVLYEYTSLCNNLWAGNFPLHAAVDSGSEESVRVLMEAGAPIEAQQKDRSTPVHFACARGLLAIVRLMFELQPQRKFRAMAMRDRSGYSPLHRAVLFDFDLVAKFLVEVSVYSNDQFSADEDFRIFIR